MYVIYILHCQLSATNCLFTASHILTSSVPGEYEKKNALYNDSKVNYVIY